MDDDEGGCGSWGLDDGLSLRRMTGSSSYFVMLTSILCRHEDPKSISSVSLRPLHGCSIN
jgi:hypothetical protein